MRTILDHEYDAVSGGVIINPVTVRLVGQCLGGAVTGTTGYLAGKAIEGQGSPSACGVGVAALAGCASQATGIGSTGTAGAAAAIATGMCDRDWNSGSTGSSNIPEGSDIRQDAH
jgi:hypothetical protein